MSNKVVKIKGGLGNQLFQYAHGRNIMLTQDKEVMFDISFFEGNKFATDTKRDFLLNNFNIPPEIKFISSPEYTYIKLIRRILKKGGFKFEEYFQGEKYFVGINDTIRKEFTLKKPLSPIATEWLEKINVSNNSTSIHVRRGDYISNPNNKEIYTICDQNYYENAISVIKNKHPNQSLSFFVFSDDIEWVKNNLNLEDVLYVSNPELADYEELILISKCNNQIISNSTFAWWGAWLNTSSDKIVITPKQWFLDKNKKDEIVPREWIKL